MLASFFDSLTFVFQINSSVNVNVVKRLDEDGKLERNFKNPPRKDTVIVPDGGYTILRFHATNPGKFTFILPRNKSTPWRIFISLVSSLFGAPVSLVVRCDKLNFIYFMDCADVL